MTRRVFLGVIFTLLATLSVGGLKLFTNEKRFNIFIKNSLPWLDIEQKAINTFVRDYYKYDCITLKCQIKFSFFLILETTPIFHNILQNRRKIYREPIISKVLLSTDFFKESMDEDRTIKYLAYYDPYINPCYNPKP